MLVKIAATAPQTTIESVLRVASQARLGARLLNYDDGTAVVGLEGRIDESRLQLPGVTEIMIDHKPYMLASLACREKTIVRIGDVEIGGARPVFIAGPCVIEGQEQLVRAALAAKSAGAVMLRGGAYKPRTSPYSFQGLGEEGLRVLAHAREVTGLPVVTEVLEAEQVELVAEYADMLQIGARNMANTPLLRRAGKSGKPVLLKRGFAATIEEWLLSAEYLLATGNPNVVLCERGIRSFDPALRFNLDLNAVPLVKELSHLPVLVDPSHGTGKRSLVASMAMAGLAAGADGLIIEAQPDPDSAACDAYQTIDAIELEQLIQTGMAVSGVLAAARQPAELALV